MISISFEKFTLPNGLDVILHEDHSLPIAAVNLWYHVGSKDEEPGRTGFAHLFEHVMFEGSKHHNKSYFEPLQRVGASLNGSTTPDRTNYWENVPANHLELALWLESDRMGFLLDALDQKRFEIQRDVVKNERRQSYENRPYGMAHLLLQPAVFPSPHPYSWPTIGDPKDLDAATLDDVKAFFRKHYSPSNASLTIAGDINPDETRRLVEKFFGDIPPGQAVRRMGRMDSTLHGRVSLSMPDRVQLARLYLVWPTGPIFDVDQAPLDLLASVLGDGKSSRLYRSLVYERQIARDVRVMHYAQEIAGEFHVQATAAPGRSLSELEEAVMAELERLRKEPPHEKELVRSKNRIQNQHVRQLERFGGFGGRADVLNYYNTYTGNPGLINTDLDRYMAVTPEQVQHVVASALNGNFVRLSVVPEASLKTLPATVDRSVAPEPAGAASFRPPSVHRDKLPNGMDVVYIQKPGLPMVAFGLLVRGGAYWDPPQWPGLAHLTATMLPEGTVNRTSQQIAEEMEFLGAHLSIEANREYLVISTETLTAHWAAAMDILSDVARNATFPEKELERIRKERLTDLKRVADDPGAVCARAYRALIYGPETRYGHPLTGDIASVERLTRQQLVAHFEGYYRPDNAVFMVVGDVSRGEVMAMAERYFGDWTPRGELPRTEYREPEVGPPPATTIYLADKPGAAQSVIRVGHLTIPRHHPDYFRLNLLNYIFGGQFSARLNMNLRQDKGYSYGYHSAIEWASGPSVLLAGGSVQTAVTKEAVIETLKEFADIRGVLPVTKEEFVDAREGTLRGLPSHFETQGQTLQQITRLVLFNLPDDYFQTYVENVQAIALEDIHRVAKERIDDGHLKVLVVGDRKTIQPGLEELGLPLVQVDYEGRELGQYSANRIDDSPSSRPSPARGEGGPLSLDGRGLR